MSNFEQGMHKNDANFVPLTPISFLDRIKDVYPDYEALVYKERKYSWRQVWVWYQAVEAVKNCYGDGCKMINIQAITIKQPFKYLTL